MSKVEEIKEHEMEGKKTQSNTIDAAKVQKYPSVGSNSTLDNLTPSAAGGLPPVSGGIPMSPQAMMQQM